MRVSRLLSSLGLAPDPRWYTDESRERGHAVHAIAEAVFQDQPFTCAPQYDGYAQALVDAKRGLGLLPVFVETRIVSRVTGTSGRPDLGCVVTRKSGRIYRGPAIVDVKSGLTQPTHALQLGLYERLVSADPLGRELRRESERVAGHDLPIQRIGLYVTADGDARWTLYDNPHDRITCDSILEVARWRTANGYDCSLDDARTADGSEPDDHAAPDPSAEFARRD